MLVSKILQAKGSRVHTIGPEETIATAVARLDELGIGALVVTSHGRKAGTCSPAVFPTRATNFSDT